MIKSVITSRVFTAKKIRNVGLLEIKTDAAGERLQIFDRNSGELIWHGKSSTEVTKRVLPLKYTIDPILMCVLLDDNLDNNAAIMDGVKAKIIDANTLDLNAV
jgi:hypothetical protein